MIRIEQNVQQKLQKMQNIDYFLFLNVKYFIPKIYIEILTMPSLFMCSFALKKIINFIQFEKKKEFMIEVASIRLLLYSYLIFYHY